MLLLYFKMDNGSNVCGVEFNYNNKTGKKGEEKRGDEEGNKKKEVEEGENEKEEDKDDSKSIIGVNHSAIEVHFNDQLLRKLILSKFEVESEEGRSVHLCPNLFFSSLRGKLR